MDVNLPNPTNETTTDNVAVVWRTSLKTTTETEDKATAQDGTASAKIIADRSSDCGSDKGTSRQKGRDETDFSSRGSELVLEGLTRHD